MTKPDLLSIYYTLWPVSLLSAQALIYADDLSPSLPVLRRSVIVYFIYMPIKRRRGSYR